MWQTVYCELFPASLHFSNTTSCHWLSVNKIEGKIKRLFELGTFTGDKIILSRVVNLQNSTFAELVDKSRKEIEKKSGFLVVWRKLGCAFFTGVLYLHTCKFSHSFYVVRLPVWCIKLSGAGVILRSHKFHNYLLCLLPLPVLDHLTVFSKSKSCSSFTSEHGQSV